MTQPNPNIMHNTTHNNNEEAQTNEIVPLEISQLLEPNSSTLDSDDANLVRQILPGMVDNDNQPLPENGLLPELCIFFIYLHYISFALHLHCIFILHSPRN